MSKQTAVEYLIQYMMDNQYFVGNDLADVFDQAKVMEKEQRERMYSEEDMEKAFTNGLNRSFDSDFDRWFENFKNNTQ
jgi:hypothetical protein